MFLTQNEKDNLIKQNKHLIVNKRYASLLRRIWGGLLDAVILAVAPFIIGFLIGLFFTKAFNHMTESISFAGILLGYSLLFYLVYYIYFMSSKKQTTLGYYFAGMRYARADAKTISIARAATIIIVGFILDASISIIVDQILGESNGAKIFESILFIIIFISPYFFTKRKQFLIEWLFGVVTLDKTKDNLDDRSKLNNEISG